MAQEPKNPRMWAMYVAQAKAHFNVYPSPAASHWVHQHYTQAGGQFVETDSKSESRRREVEKRHHEAKKKHGRGKDEKDEKK